MSACRSVRLALVSVALALPSTVAAAGELRPNGVRLTKIGFYVRPVDVVAPAG